MKTVNTIVKILAALAAITGVVYVVATYGDQIVAWAKKLLASCPCNQECEIVEEDFVAEEAPAAEAPVEEAAEEEAPVAEGPEVEIVVENNEPVAEEADFEA